MVMWLVLFYLVGCILSWGLNMDARHSWAECPPHQNKRDIVFCTMFSFFSWICAGFAIANGARKLRFKRW